MSTQFHLAVSLSMATLTKNKKWSLHLKFCETDSKVSTPLNCRDNHWGKWVCYCLRTFALTFQPFATECESGNHCYFPMSYTEVLNKLNKRELWYDAFPPKKKETEKKIWYSRKFINWMINVVLGLLDKLQKMDMQDCWSFTLYLSWTLGASSKCSQLMSFL